MVCLNPKYVKFEWYNKINEKTGEIYRTKRLKFKNPIDDINIETEIIPCGKCEGCRIDKANDWATRAYLESQNHAKNAFLTLTYDNDHLNKKRSLEKADLQKFWKRLRKAIAPEKISYLACGEYGPKTLRPHYHAAVFGYWPNDFMPYKKNAVGDMLYTSEKLNKIWGNGYVIVGNVTYESAAYIARYVFKKAYGGEQIPLKAGKIPEYTTASKRPAIAKNFYFTPEKWAKILRNNGVMIATKDGLKIKPIPVYFRNKWKENDHENYFAWQAEQRKKQLSQKKENLKNTDKNFAHYQKDTTTKKQKALNRLDKFRGNMQELA